MNIVTALIFIIVVSRPHAFFLVVVVRSSLHVLVAVAVNYYFQHTPAAQSDDIHLPPSIELGHFDPDMTMISVAHEIFVICNTWDGASVISLECHRHACWDNRL